MFTLLIRNVPIRCRHAVLGGALAALALAVPVARATESGGSVYPVGVETVNPGLSPASGQTILLMFNVFSEADASVNSEGKSSVPGFRVRIGVVCPKVVHGWGVHFLGGTLFSTAALPMMYKAEWLPTGRGDKMGFTNPSLGLAELGYNKGSLHWWYGCVLYLPGFVYHRTDLMNTGQHDFAQAPQGAITWLPYQGRTELSSKFQYIFNDTDPATHYRSGDEAIWEFDGMQKFGKHLSVGGNGYLYHQTTADLKNDLMYEDGHYGRDLAYGPEIKYRMGKVTMTAKYLKDALTQDKSKGQAFWLQLGIPLNEGHKD
jgi:hypothetical protein